MCFFIFIFIFIFQVSHLCLSSLSPTLAPIQYMGGLLWHRAITVGRILYAHNVYVPVFNSFKVIPTIIQTHPDIETETYILLFCLSWGAPFFSILDPKCCSSHIKLLGAIFLFPVQTKSKRLSYGLFTFSKAN